MVRKIIKIDKEKCNGCGACATACHEGAIAMIDGKAQLVREDYCDGLGDCLPACPTGAISFEEREAKAYDEAAVRAQKNEKKTPTFGVNFASALAQWPCQLRLVPESAPYLDGAHLLIAADCTAFSYANFHSDFMRGHITLIACPKLDKIDYSQKLTNMIFGNNIKSITVVRMEVPCCRGIELAVKKALQNTGKQIPLHTVTITTDGKILEN